MNFAMLPELHSPTVMDLITANMYIRKMKEYIIVCYILPDDSVDEETNFYLLIYWSYHIIMINVCTRVMALD